MSDILDILIQKHEISKIALTEKFNEWGGEKFSYEPPIFEADSGLQFHTNNEMNYYDDIVGDKIELDKYIVFTLEGDKLSDLEIKINQRADDALRSELMMFMQMVFEKLESVCILKFRNEEIIDYTLTINDVQEAVKVFVDSFKWDSPCGICIVKTR